MAVGKRDAGNKAARRIHNRQLNTTANIQDRIRRRDAVERANRRKAMLRGAIEKIAREATADDFAGRLKAEGMTLCPLKKGWGVTVTLEDDKERSYTFDLLGVDESLVTPLLFTSPDVEKDSFRGRKEPEWKRVVPPPSRSVTGTIVRKTGRLFNKRSEQSGGQSREDEISKGNYEDYDDTHRSGGMKR